MYVTKLELTDFRNYEKASVEFSKGTNIIYGKNAQGKTNLLEAICMFSYGRSPRVRHDREMVRFSADAANMLLEFEDAERHYKVVVRIMKDGRKLIKINNVAITKLSRLMRYLNTVMFSPEDLELVKGSPGARRRFVDTAVSQLYPAYMRTLSEYHKALAEKNSLLKQLALTHSTDTSTLDVWNTLLAASGIKLMRSRAAFIEKIGAAAADIQCDISGEILELRYAPSIEAETEEDLYAAFTAAAERELRAGASVVGVQRDDIRFTIDGGSAARYGSQGQQRTAVLAVKLAQAEYIKEVRGEYPVMLLDDIMSELDGARRAYLAERIRDKQVIITCTDRETVAADSGKLFYVESGHVREV